MAHATDLLLIILDRATALMEADVGQGADQAVGPVEVFGRHASLRVGIVLGHGLDVGVQRDQRVKRVGAKGHPLHGAIRRLRIGAQLQHGELAVAVDADGAIGAARGGRALTAVAVVLRALVVAREYVLNVLDGHLALGHTAPGDVVALGRVVGVGAVPHIAGVEAALHVPGARRVVDVVAVAVRAKGLARVKDRRRAVALDAQRQVQMPLGHPGAQVGGAHVVGLVALGVVQVKAVDTQLVRHGHIGVVGHALGDPVMAADGLEPPDLVHVAKGDAVVLVGAVALEQVAQDTDAVAGGLGIRQDQGHHVLLAQATRLRRHIAVLTLVALGGHVVHERIGAANALVGGERLGCGHANIELVEARLGPDAVTGNNIGDARVAHGVVGQLNGQVAQDARIDARLLVGVHHAHALGLKHPVGRVLIAGNQRRPVVARVLTNQNRCARHAHPP